MKKFLIIGNGNAVTYKEIFPLIKNNQLWLGISWVKEFIQANKETKKFGNICWFTNVEHNKRNTPLDLYKRYSIEYPKYDNYDAIEVSKVSDIPMDYDGVMGVPITFLDKYCPEQFEIVGMAAGNSAVNNFGASAGYKKHQNDRGGCGIISGNDGRAKLYVGEKATYARILIRKRNA